MKHINTKRVMAAALSAVLGLGSAVGPTVTSLASEDVPCPALTPKETGIFDYVPPDTAPSSLNDGYDDENSPFVATIKPVIVKSNGVKATDEEMAAWYGMGYSIPLKKSSIRFSFLTHTFEMSPELEDTSKGLYFIGWEDENGNELSEAKVELNSTNNVTFIAKYGIANAKLIFHADGAWNDAKHAVVTEGYSYKSFSPLPEPTTEPQMEVGGAYDSYNYDWNPSHQKPVRENYVFYGWKTADGIKVNGTDIVSLGDNYTVEHSTGIRRYADINLYADLELKTYTVNYSYSLYNGSDFKAIPSADVTNDNPRSYKYGDEAFDFVDASYDDYQFAGFVKYEPNGSTGGAKYTIASGITDTTWSKYDHMNMCDITSESYIGVFIDKLHTLSYNFNGGKDSYGRDGTATAHFKGQRYKNEAKRISKLDALEALEARSGNGPSSGSVNNEDIVSMPVETAEERAARLAKEALDKKYILAEDSRPEREGYNFMGWNTKQDGTGTVVDADTVMGDTDTRVYAMWEALAEPAAGESISSGPDEIAGGEIIKNITYAFVDTEGNAVEANVSNPDTYSYYAGTNPYYRIQVTLNTPSVEGYDFIGYFSTGHAVVNNNTGENLTKITETDKYYAQEVVYGAYIENNILHVKGESPLVTGVFVKKNTLPAEETPKNPDEGQTGNPSGGNQGNPSGEQQNPYNQNPNASGNSSSYTPSGNGTGSGSGSGTGGATGGGSSDGSGDAKSPDNQVLSSPSPSVSPSPSPSASPNPSTSSLMPSPDANPVQSVSPSEEPYNQNIETDSDASIKDSVESISDTYGKDNVNLIGNTWYALIDGKVQAVGAYKSDVADITVKSRVAFGDADYPVTGIIAGAFSGMENLKNVTTERGIRDIFSGAFDNCRNLTSFTMNNKGKKARVHANAFGGCKNLKSIKITAKKVTLDKNAFGSSNVKKVIINAKNVNIKKGAFKNPEKIKFIVKGISKADIEKLLKKIGAR